VGTAGHFQHPLTASHLLHAMFLSYSMVKKWISCLACAVRTCLPTGVQSRSCRIIESFRLEKTFKIMESNHKPNTAKSSSKSCP